MAHKDGASLPGAIIGLDDHDRTAALNLALVEEGVLFRYTKANERADLLPVNAPPAALAARDAAGRWR